MRDPRARELQAFIASPSEDMGDDAALNMRERIEQALNVLLGLPFQDVMGVATLMQFHFGAPVLIPDYRKGRKAKREVNEYALHVQCDWRIVGPAGIVTGTNDWYYPKGDDPYNEPPDFDSDIPGSNRLSERITLFRELLRQNTMVVQEIWADHTGSVRLALSGGYSIELFPSHTLRYEHWRLFKPGDTSDHCHFVVTGVGIED